MILFQYCNSKLCLKDFCILMLFYRFWDFVSQVVNVCTEKVIFHHVFFSLLEIKKMLFVCCKKSLYVYTLIIILDRERDKDRDRDRERDRRHRSRSRDRRKRSRSRSKERRERKRSNSPKKNRGSRRRKQSLYWDVPPPGFEHITPLQVKIIWN